MNWQGAILWGLVATLIMTMLLSGSQGLRLTRISMPFLMGSIFTPHRDLANAIGFCLHMINGWVFALLYAAVFEDVGRTGWWLGGFLGLLHGMFILLVIMPILPGLHPRMASEQRGPTPTRQLEPPGFLGLNYGTRTPVAIVIAHVIYGAILGAFYHVS